MLRELFRAEASESPGIDIICVHGLNSQGVSHDRPQWASMLADIVPKNSTILDYDLEATINDKFKWQDTLGKGPELLEAMWQYHVNAKNPNRPLVLFGHSLGGIVVKQVYRSLSMQFNKFPGLMATISGIVFLGTPHITKQDDEGMQQLLLTMRSDLMSEKKRPPKEEDLLSIVEICSRFAEMRFAIPVLSCYETLQTKLRAPVWRPRRVVVVDKHLATISATTEKLIGIDAALENPFELSGTAVRFQVGQYLLEVLKEAHTEIEIANKPAYSTGVNSVTDSDPGSNHGVAIAIPVPDSPQKNRFLTSTRRSSLIESGSPKSLSISSCGPSPSWERVPCVSEFAADTPKLPVKLPCYYIRPDQHRNRDFCGRSDIVNMIDHAFLQQEESGLSANQEHLRTFVLCGPGGIGKTQIANEYMWARKDEYKAIFWIKADDAASLEQEFRQIAIRLGLEPPDTTSSPSTSRDLVKAWLRDPVRHLTSSETRPAKWLMVLDSVDIPEILDGFWPQGGQGWILMTSRDPLTRSQYGEHGVDVKGLEIEDAAALLRKLAHPSKDEASADLAPDIAKRLECYPLAIIQMAGITRRRQWSLATFIALYNTESERAALYHERFGRYQGYTHTLASVWAFEEFSAGASSILNVLAFLDHNCIQESILNGSPADAQLPDFPLTKGAYYRDLTELTQSSMVRKNSDGDELYLHGLVQEVAKSNMSGSGSRAMFFSATVRLLSRAWPFALKPFNLAKAGYPRAETVDCWEQCKKLVPHVLRIKNEFHLLGADDKRSCASFQYLLILNEAAWYHFACANIRASVDLVDAALESFKYSTEDVRVVLGQSHSIRYNLAARLNSPDRALYHAKAQMAVQDGIFSEIHEATRVYGIAVMELGQAFMNMGLLTEADELLKKTRRIREGDKEFNRHSLFTMLLGRACLLSMRGEYDGAAETLLVALRDHKEACGPDDNQGERTGDLLYGLGKVRYSQGLVDESLTYYFRAVAQYRVTIGDMHTSTARAAYKLAEHYMRLRYFENASNLLEQARKVYRRELYHYGREHARTHFKFGQLLQLKGDGVAAQGAFSRACEMRREFVRDDDRDASELQEADYDSLIMYWTR